MASSKLFVGNLPWSATEDELRSLFGADVAEVKIITDRETGRSRGFGFVTMTDVDAAREAMQRLDGTDFNGREMRVNEAHEKERRPSNGGGFRQHDHGGGDGGQRRGGGRGGRGGRQRRRDDDDYSDY